MRIGEVAARANVNVETLRYYERRGLLPEPRRSVGGHRDYDEETVRFVCAVKEAQSLGFSLGEIEAYLRLSSRAPGKASEAARAQLAGKLAEVDGQISSLRTVRAGLTRALDEVWGDVHRSTSAAAYLARGGANPSLGTDEPLHVTNGESVASTLRTTPLPGVVLSWDDVLHVGPLAFEPGECRRLRAAFLAEHGWGDRASIEVELARRDELLDLAADRPNPIVLWFEQDLVDQLQLLQVVARLSAEAHVELIRSDDYLGRLDAAALERLWDTRVPLGRDAQELARDGWRAVCDDRLEPFLTRDTSALPYLEPALRRLIEERAPLSRTKRQLLTLLADGPRTPLGLFVANQKLEDAVFLGDTLCFLFLEELAEDGLVTGLPAPPPRGDYEAYVTTIVELTAAGRSLL